MSFDIDRAFDVGLTENRRRKRKSAIPDFTGDIDLDSLSRGNPFPTSDVFGKRTVRKGLLKQRSRVEQTPLRLEAEGQIKDAFLTDPLAAPITDPSRMVKERKRNNVARGQKSLLTERERLRRGGKPRSRRQTEFEFENIRSLGF